MIGKRRYCRSDRRVSRVRNEFAVTIWKVVFEVIELRSFAPVKGRASSYKAVPMRLAFGRIGAARLAVLIALTVGALTPPVSAAPAAAVGDQTPPLHVTGRFLENPSGKIINLHGYMQPGSSWFNGEGHNYRQPNDFTNPVNVAPALAFYDRVADIMSHHGPMYGARHGWYCNFVRFIGDGSAPENFAPGWDANGNLTYPGQFIGWIDNEVVPFVNHCRANGMYVVLVGNPSEIFPGGDHTRNMTQQYQQNLIAFWKAVASNPGIRNADNVMFEICNEPIANETSFGTNDWGSGNDAHWIAITDFMQPIVDAIRQQGSKNVVWIPGLGWQGEYAGFANHPVLGSNVGYAAHVYPGYGGAHDDPALVDKLWASNYKPCADKSPMIITEMAWSPNDGEGYKDLWNAHTVGFGNAIKRCIDTQGNVSYLVGMTGDHFPNIDKGLTVTQQSTSESSRAVFEWFAQYAGWKPAAKTPLPTERLTK